MRTLTRLLLRGVRDLAAHPWPTLLTVAAVAMAAFLAGLLLMALHNLDAELARHSGKVQFQVYWETSLPRAEVAKAWEGLGHLEGLVETKTFTPSQGLGELMKYLGQDDAPRQLLPREDNPIPPTALLTFQVPPQDPGFAGRTRDKLASMPGVASVHHNPMQMELAASWVGAVHRILWPLIILMTLVAGFIVGNTMRLALMGRADEIDILRLVGATRAYIKIPLLAGGAVQGLVGALGGLVLLKIMQLSVKNALNEPPLFIRIDFLPADTALTLAAALTLVGLASSWVAVRR
jgi:cell division transport system permease protein